MSIPRIHAPTAIAPTRQLLEEFLSEEVAAGAEFLPDETIQFSWIWLKIASDGSGAKVTAPEFGVMPMNFIDDCSESLNLVARQRYVADSFDADYGWCNCVQYAIAVRDFGDCRQRFMNRVSPESDNDSGWVLGAEDSSLDVKDPESFEAVSLWELFCSFPTLGDFFLLPEGWQVELSGTPKVLMDYEQIPPKDGSYFSVMYSSD